VLLGHPVAHSLSPRFQNAALRATKIDLTYDALDVAPDELPRVLDALVREGAAGNVTIPHKAAVAARSDRLTSVAERCGAVNTFWVEEDGALVGDNTDVGGFEGAVRSLLGSAPAGALIALLGAGGGARAVLAAVEGWRECRVSLYSRTRHRAAELASRFPIIVDVRDDPRQAVHGASLVVNATPIGMADDAHPAPIDAFAPHAAVLDLVYREGETSWVRAARSAGHPAADGLEMLVEQGALAFERWFDIAASRDLMRASVGRASRTMGDADDAGPSG
jgi:shikimate dehydrogenase